MPSYPLPGFRTPIPKAFVVCVEPSLDSLWPEPGKLTSGWTTKGFTAWSMIKGLWQATKAPLHMSSWTISPKIARELAMLSERLPLGAFILDQSQGGRNGSLKVLEPLGDKLKLVRCHAKVATTGPYMWLGSSNLSDSRGIEAWVCVHDQSFSDSWTKEMLKWGEQHGQA